MSNGYFQSPCRKRLDTRLTDLDADDFSLKVLAQPGEDPGTFDITTTLKPKANFGDVEGFVTAGNATLYDETDGEMPAVTAAGPNTMGAPGALALSFAGVVQSANNVGNTWKLVVANVQVTAKDGQVLTLPVLSKTFPSPL